MSKLLPISIIIGATKAEPEAVNTVLAHYRSYITYLASRYSHYDVEAREAMESRLMEALLKFRIN